MPKLRKKMVWHTHELILLMSKNKEVIHWKSELLDEEEVPLFVCACERGEREGEKWGAVIFMLVVTDSKGWATWVDHPTHVQENKTTCVNIYYCYWWASRPTRILPASGQVPVLLRKPNNLGKNTNKARVKRTSNPGKITKLFILVKHVKRWRSSKSHINNLYLCRLIAEHGQ